MATLIPSMGACAGRMTSGERRLAERLEKKLDGDYLLWYDVPVGPLQAHPDFLVMHPSRGLLVLEVKDWKPATILQADKTDWTLLDSSTHQPKTVASPMEQARQYAHQVVRALERDPALVQASGRHQGKLAFPWSYGVVLTHLTRKQFTQGGLGDVMEPLRVLCQDEMTEGVEAEALQSRLWDMFPYGQRGVMSLPMLERVRWILFPEVRVAVQGALWGEQALPAPSGVAAGSVLQAGHGERAESTPSGATPPMPEQAGQPEADWPTLMRVMDIQQEQLARSLGDGHRVIHGVAGSGKTMILGYRAEILAKVSGPGASPILILCYNEPLAVTLAARMQAKGLADKVHARHFHKWCRDQLVAFGQELPPAHLPVDVKMADMVQRVITAVDRQFIPSGQYQAVLIDEGHDFAPEWLKLVTQMVDPATHSLLLLYDDAQSIYERARKQQFSFKSVGVQAQGRTTILKINYRNTRQILQLASLIAADLLTAHDQDDDGVPLVKPVSCGREGPPPQVLRLPNLRDEVFAIADHLRAAHQQGHAWGDMAVICRNWDGMRAAETALRHHKLPHQVRQSSGDYRPASDTIKVLTMHASKGLEFAVVALPGIGHMPQAGADEADEARLFYVAATRATHQLLVTVSGEGGFGQKIAKGFAAPPLTSP